MTGHITPTEKHLLRSATQPFDSKALSCDMPPVPLVFTKPQQPSDNAL